MSIFITGDCHGQFSRFTRKKRGLLNIKEDDYVIICGDFGLCWEKDSTYEYNLKFFEQLPFTTLFVQGNHENYDMLSEYKLEQWHGGLVRHIVRDKVILLERGQIFNIEGKTIFAFGGASSHDISDGILDPSDFKTKEDFKNTLRIWNKTKRFFRVKGITWWEQELPTDEEINTAINNLTKVENKVDYIITHCCSTEIAYKLGFKDSDKLTDFFNYVDRNVKFKQWYFGHYHDNVQIDSKHTLLYEAFDKID